MDEENPIIGIKRWMTQEEIDYWMKQYEETKDNHLKD
jgi:hypothetical protein